MPPAWVELVCWGGEWRAEAGNEVVVGEAEDGARGEKVGLLSPLPRLGPRAWWPALAMVKPPWGRLDIEAFSVGGNGSCDVDDCESRLGFVGKECGDVAIEF